MALIISDDVPLDIAELRWVARRRRQKILGTVDYGAYISETALRTPFGGPEGHRNQLKHLLGARDRGIPHIALSTSESQTMLRAILKEA